MLRFSVRVDPATSYVRTRGCDPLAVKIDDKEHILHTAVFGIPTHRRRNPDDSECSKPSR